METEEMETPQSIEDRLRSMQNRLEELERKFADLQAGVESDITSLAMAIRTAYSTALSSQILAETISRYIAGYTPGQFEEEYNKLAKDNKVEELKIISHDGSFDTDRFLGLAKETAKVFVQMRQAEFEKAKKAAELKKSNIVQLEKPKIIVP